MFHRIKRDLPRALSRFRNVSMWQLPGLYGRAIRLQFNKSRVKKQPKESRNESIVVTLTTIPSRLERVIPVLKSLIDQQTPADQILLAVPWHSLREDTSYREDLLHALPDEVTVLRCEDLGPATKLLPALKQMTSSVLVVVDDDIIYPCSFLRILLAAHRRNPKAAFGFRGVRLDEGIPFADLRHVFATAVDRDFLVDVLFGTWGYLVPSGALGAEVHDFSRYPEEVRWVDDIWISGHLAKRGVPRYVMPAPEFPVETPLSFRQALTDGVNRSGENDRITIEQFKLFWNNSKIKSALDGKPHDQIDI